MTDVTAIIAELENELLGKKNIFGKCYVDEMKVTSILSRLRDAIPSSFYEAQSLLRQQDALIADAEHRAELILKNANEARDKMIAESEVLAEAKKEAAEVAAQADRYCDDLTATVHQKMDRELYDIAYRINDAMILIENLRDELMRRSGGGNPPSGDGNN